MSPVVILWIGSMAGLALQPVPAISGNPGQDPQILRDLTCLGSAYVEPASGRACYGTGLD